MKNFLNSSDKSRSGVMPREGASAHLCPVLLDLDASPAPTDAGIKAAFSFSKVVVSRPRPANQSTTYSPPGPKVQSGAVS